MPAGKEGGAEERRGSNAAKRETFRPPWVKEGPDGLPPKPSNLWSKTRQASKDGPAPDTITVAAPKKQTTVKVNQSQLQENGTPTKENTFVRPQLKPVPPKEQTKLQSKEVKMPIKLNSVADRQRDSPELRKPPLNRSSTLTSEEKNIEKAIPTERNAIIRQESMKKLIAPKTPAAPPMPPPAPFLRPSALKPLSDKQKEHIESLKSRPKVRPDWTAMLKEVEGGRKLKHVECNDRSKPLLPQTKDSDEEQFIYESEKKEKETSHNQLLKQIQQGVALKKVKTNDRSKPMLEGLRKFRRQMTIEEQIIKSQSMASIPPDEIADEADELDDIDKVRDDLQSTKQMLAFELRNKEALARDNKRLQARLAQLETDATKEKTNKKSAVVEATEEDEKLLKSLKSEAADARKIAEDLEKKYHDASDQLDHTKSELEEVRKQKLLLEKKLQDSIMGGKRLSLSDRKDSVKKESESEEEEEITESESGESDDEEKKERKAQREIKQLKNKLRSYKNKEDNAKKERMALKTQIKRLQDAMKEEKKKYKGLKKEVNKMAALMKEVGDDSEEEEEEKDEDSETETETESETESSETESESEKSVSEAEDAPVEKKKTNLTKRSKKHEGRLTALKKGNYMLKTNVERLQDDLNKQKEESLSLQQDLDSVLAELG